MTSIHRHNHHPPINAISVDNELSEAADREVQDHFLIVDDIGIVLAAMLRYGTPKVKPDDPLARFAVSNDIANVRNLAKNRFNLLPSPHPLFLRP
jgi:hypothetical protein